MVAIVGAGVVGCSVAWELSNNGASVLLIDEHLTPLQGVSRSGFGSLTPYSDPYFTGPARAHAARGVELYRTSWIRSIAEASGLPISFQDLGLIKLCQSEDDFAAGCEHAAELRSHSYRAEVLTVEGVRRLEPNLLGDFVGGIFLEDEPWLDREEYFAALTASILGQPRIDWRHECTVTAVTIDHSTLQITLSRGDTIRADYVVVCSGLQAEKIAGVPSIPLQWVRGDAIMVCTPDDRPLLKRHVYQTHGFITPRRDGHMLLGATYVPENGMPPEYYRRHWERVEVEHVKNLIEFNQAILPSIGSCDICGVWRGWRPTPPDNMPVLGPLQNEARIIIATGYIGLGITMAPATAEAIRHYCMAGDASHFPDAFDPMRFETNTGA